MKNTTITIHVDNEKCRRWWFRPTNQRLEPLYDFARVAKHQPNLREEFARLGTVPGHYVTIESPGLEEGKPDFTKTFGKIGRLIDDTKWSEIEQVYRESTGDFPLGSPGTRPAEEVYPLESADELATWLFWMNLGVHHKSVKLVKGSLPTIEQIRRLGNVRTNDLFAIQTKDGHAPVGLLPKVTGPAKETAAS